MASFFDAKEQAILFYKLGGNALRARSATIDIPHHCIQRYEKGPSLYEREAEYCQAPQQQQQQHQRR